MMIFVLKLFVIQEEDTTFLINMALYSFLGGFLYIYNLICFLQEKCYNPVFDSLESNEPL